MDRCDSYIICTSPRSGSTLLCSLLAATGIAGRPGSHFHQSSLAAWLDAYDIQPHPAASEEQVLRAVFRAAIARGRGENGVFGLRLQRHSFDHFIRKLAVLYPAQGSDRARIEAAFGRTRFVYLARRDKLDQAISYEKARQSGLWHQAPDGTELERRGPPRACRYDGAELLARSAEFAAFDRDWEAWFATEGISPLRIDYTALAEDPLACLADVLAALGLTPTAASGVVPGTTRLADATNLDWKRRLLHESACR